MNSQGSTPLRHLAVPGQLLAWSMVIFPLSGVLLTVLVPGAGGPLGRARALGVLLESMLSPLVGVFLGAFLAEFFGQRGLRRFYSKLCAVTGVLFLLVAPFFLRDAVAVRVGIQPEMKQLYDANLVRGALLFGAVGAFLLLLGRAISTALRREHAGASVPGAALVGTTARG